MERPLTEQEFLDWKASPATQAILQGYLEADKLSLKDQWAAGAFQQEQPLETAVANAQAIGVYQKLSEIQDLKYDQYYEAVTGDPYIKEPEDE